MRYCLQCSRPYADDVRYCPHDGRSLPPPDPLLGLVIDGKYRIDALQGTGGMGAVYRATQINLERTVAFKVVRGDFLKDAVITERFRREALAVARLKHPHIVTVYDFGITPDGGAYLVMEFLDGHSLRDEIHDGKALPIGRAVDLMRQICSAVHAAHAAGIIHRDLKPDNIFLEHGADGSPAVKVLDFGVAKIRQTTEAVSLDLTISGAIIGTPIYMSPEQCQGDQLDARSDVYSLGCVFFEMVAGRPPFVAQTPTALIIKHAGEAPRPPSEFREGVPHGLELAILKALAKRAEDRFQSAADFAKALSEVWVPLDSESAFSASIGTDVPITIVDEVDSLISNLSKIETPQEGRQRLAVLPFRNVAKDASIDFLEFALADGIITHLSSLPGLLVRPSTLIERYTGSAVDAAEVSRQLEVDLLVSGTFIKSGRSFQVSAQLVDVTGPEVLWQRRFRAETDNVIELQDRVIEEVSAGVAAKIGLGEAPDRPSLPGTIVLAQSAAGQAEPVQAPPPTPPPPAPPPPARPPAKSKRSSKPLAPPPEMPTTASLGTPANGTASLGSTETAPSTAAGAGSPARPPRPSSPIVEEAKALGYTTEARVRAIELLERAVDTDPDNAEAWALLTSRYYEASAYTFKPEGWEERARDAADRALALDASQLALTVALGRTLVEAGRAEEVLRRAADLVARGLDLAGVHYAMGYAARFGGLLERAAREFRTVNNLEPGLGSSQLALALLQLGQYDDAAQLTEEVLTKQANPQTLHVTMLARGLAGDRKNAKRAAAANAKIDPNGAYTIMGQVFVARLEGRSVGALIGWLDDVHTEDGELHYWLAQTHAFAGDTERAVARLRRAVLGGYFNATYMERDPLLASLRGHPEAAKLIEAARHRHERLAKREKAH